METKFLLTFVVALNLCQLAMSFDVANAFTRHDVVPHAVDVAPREAITVKNVKSRAQ